MLACAQKRLIREDIDVRMCKALGDLPSDLGLEAVDKFAMANLDTVRSKTGFMVGFKELLLLSLRPLPYTGRPSALVQMGIIKRLQTDTVPPPRYGGPRDRYDRGYERDRFERDRYERDRYDRDRYARGYDRGYDRYDRGYDRGYARGE